MLDAADAVTAFGVKGMSSATKSVFEPTERESRCEKKISIALVCGAAHRP